MKGTIHIDYIIAMSISILLLSIIVVIINNFFFSFNSQKEIEYLSSQGFALINIADREHTFSGENITRIGLKTRAYRMVIIMNNTAGGGGGSGDIENETATFNYTEMGFSGIDINSTVIYDENGKDVPYIINSDNITLWSDIALLQTKYFFVYFDDDSNFTAHQSIPPVNQGGSFTNDITETYIPPQELSVIQYKKIIELENTPYVHTKNITGLQNFNITIMDLNTSTVFFSYGDVPPKKGNIIAYNRYILFQNSTAGIRNGTLTTKVW